MGLQHAEIEEENFYPITHDEGKILRGGSGEAECGGASREGQQQLQHLINHQRSGMQRGCSSGTTFSVGLLLRRHHFFSLTRVEEELSPLPGTVCVKASDSLLV